MSGRDSQDVPLPLSQPSTASVRDSQDVTLAEVKPTTAKARDSQDLPLPVEKPSTAKVRDSQDLLLFLMQLLGARDSQDLPLVLAEPTTSQARLSQDIALYLQSNVVAPPPTAKCSDYYLSLITSEYQNSPNFLTWLQFVLSTLCDLRACLNLMYANFDLYGVGVNTTSQSVVGNVGIPIAVVVASTQGMQTGVQLVFDSGAEQEVVAVRSVSSSPPSFVAVFSKTHLALGVPVISFNQVPTIALGPQLDILGTIVGVSRTVPFQPSNSVSPVLDDDTYRTLIKAKVAFNQWNGQAGSLYPIWQTLFPGGNIAIQDNQNMTATIFLTGAFTSITQDLIINGLIIPRPETVQYNYVFGTLPAFGFGAIPGYIAGFGVGHWN